jgi:hypothetical protein
MVTLIKAFQWIPPAGCVINQYVAIAALNDRTIATASLAQLWPLNSM